MEWFVYESIEPFGEMGAYLRAGIIASTIANVNRDTKKKSDPFSPKDFMPDFEENVSDKAKLQHTKRILAEYNRQFKDKK